MRIVVIGGTGLIGSKVIGLLEAKGQEAVASAPNTGVNTITGEGLAEVLQGTDVVLDLANSPSFEDSAVMEFFETAGHNLSAAEANAGVGHHVALSIVGADRLPDSGYLRAKVRQEQLIRAGGVPYTIIRSTQFFEFMRGIADAATEGDTVRVPSGKMRPIAAVDVAAAVADVALAAPRNGTIEIAGPEVISMEELMREVLASDHDPRTVVADPHARYFGTEVDDTALIPAGEARLGTVHFAEWLKAAR